MRSDQLRILTLDYWFSLGRKLYMGLRLSECYAIFRAISFHPEATTVVYEYDNVLVLGNSIWLSVLIGWLPIHHSIWPSHNRTGCGRMSIQMDNGVPKCLSLFVKRRGDSSMCSKQECLKEVSKSRRSWVVLHPLASLHIHQSPFTRKPKGTKVLFCATGLSLDC